MLFINSNMGFITYRIALIRHVASFLIPGICFSYVVIYLFSLYSLFFILILHFFTYRMPYIGINEYLCTGIVLFITDEYAETSFNASVQTAQHCVSLLFFAETRLYAQYGIETDFGRVARMPLCPHRGAVPPVALHAQRFVFVKTAQGGGISG